MPDTLKNQLIEGGKIVVPVDSEDGKYQQLLVYTKIEGQLVSEYITDVYFVPTLNETEASNIINR